MLLLCTRNALYYAFLLVRMTYNNRTHKIGHLKHTFHCLKRFTIINLKYVALTNSWPMSVMSPFFISFVQFLQRVPPSDQVCCYHSRRQRTTTWPRLNDLLLQHSCSSLAVSLHVHVTLWRTGALNTQREAPCKHGASLWVLSAPPDWGASSSEMELCTHLPVGLFKRI